MTEKTVSSVILLVWILGIVIHLWTFVVAHSLSGPGAALLTLVLPGLSQIYWFMVVGTKAGFIANYYCLAIMAYVGLWGIGLFGLSSRESQEA